MSKLSSSPAELARQGLEDLFLEVNGLANQLRKTAANLHLPDGLPAGGRGLLRILLHNGPSTVPLLARATLTSRQNIQVLVNRLCADGLVDLASNPAHKRSGLIQLSPKGESLLTSVLKREAALWMRLVAESPGSLVESTVSLLRHLRESLAANSSREAPKRPPKKRRKAKSAGGVAIAAQVAQPEPATGPPTTVVEQEEVEDGGLPVSLL